MATPVDLTAPPPHGAPLTATKRKGMSRATKLLIAVAALLVITGLVLKLMVPDRTGQLTTNSVGGASLVDGQGNAIPQTQSTEPDWAPGFLKMGFAFFVCFAIGFAARKFVKIGLVIAGGVFALFFLGQYLGFLDVKWEVMSQYWDGFTSKLGTQFESAKAFVTGSLPATGMGGVGLYAGFRQG